MKMQREMLQQHVTITSYRYYSKSVLHYFKLLRISHQLNNANFHTIISFNEIKTVRIKSSYGKLIFIVLGKRKSESESQSIEVTSGISTDKGEEKKKKKGKKLVKHQDKKRKGRVCYGYHCNL